MRKLYLLEPGFNEPTKVYELKRVKVKTLKQATIKDIEDYLDGLGTIQLVVDAGYANIVDRLRLKWLVHRILRRRPNKLDT